MLDDDDEYLSGGTDVRNTVFEVASSGTLLFTSGFQGTQRINEPVMGSIEMVSCAQYIFFFESNWLSNNPLSGEALHFPSFLQFALRRGGRLVLDAATNQSAFRVTTLAPSPVTTLTMTHIRRFIGGC
jgi:hypothetical protein